MPNKTRRTATAVLILLTITLLPATAVAQAPASLTGLRVAYMTQKAKVNPQGELAATLGVLEKEMAEAARLGKTGEARRLLAKGMTLLAGTPWTPELEYARSLVLRTDHVVSDSSKPLVVRLEQIYSPSIELPAGLGARLGVIATGRSAPAGPAGEPVIARSFEVPGPVPRDLQDTPLSIELDLSGLADGTYRLALSVTATPGQPTLRGDQQSLGSAALTIAAITGLDERLGRLSVGAQSLPGALQADVLSPVDFVRNVNLAKIPLGGGADVARDLRNAEALLAAAKAGQDPFGGKTGDITRHYLFKPAGEILPYRLYVPTTYTTSKSMPLIVALHGLGGSEASFFEAYEKRLPAIAEKHGYILVAPLGYRPDGFYGWGVGEPPADPAARRLQERSEQDVMEVLARVRQDYRVDGSRIYLMGHSMGAIGTWRLAAKYPDIWAAIGLFSGSGTPSTVAKMGGIPQVVVHGDKDPTVPVNASRLMVAEMKRLGVEVQYIEVPGGDHSSVVPPNLEAAVSFFDTHKKK
jgi:poly(3-hydroxybutyrate) depolymerase